MAHHHCNILLSNNLIGVLGTFLAGRCIKRGNWGSGQETPAVVGERDGQSLC